MLWLFLTAPPLLAVSRPRAIRQQGQTARKQKRKKRDSSWVDLIEDEVKNQTVRQGAERQRTVWVASACVATEKEAEVHRGRVYYLIKQKKNGS